MTRVLAVATQKGGAAKSTTVANLSAAWGEAGKRVLAVDCDPQFALTVMLGADPAGCSGTLVDVLTGDHEASDVLVRGALPGVDLLPASRELASVELSLVAQVRREEFLRRALEPITGDYDIVVLDCPPNLGLLTVNALCAAGEVVAPVSMLDRGAVQGVVELQGTVRTLVTGGITVAIVAVVRTLVDRRRRLCRAIEEMLPELGLPVTETEVPLRAEFNNSALESAPVVVAHPDGLGAAAYRSLADELGGARGLRLVA